MSTPAQTVARWLPLVEEAAARYHLDSRILGALIYVESTGNPWAVRVERGFWKRYKRGIAQWVNSTPERIDDRWAKHPDLYSASYGLCQVMLQTAAENGFRYRYPTELLDPETNINLAAKILARNRSRCAGNMRQALLRYNGGADLEYPDRIARAIAHIYQEKVDL